GSSKSLIVVVQLCQHIRRRHEIRVIVRDARELSDLADRPNGGAADLSNALGNGIRGGEDLPRLLVQEQVVVPEMWSGNMPVEILRLEVQRHHVGKQKVESSGEVASRIRAESAWRLERGLASGLCIFEGHDSSYNLHPQQYKAVSVRSGALLRSAWHP